MAETLSQCIIGGSVIGTCRSQKSCLIQTNSTNVMTSALYSASVDDLETVCYFFEAHEIEFEPKNTIKPKIDLLSLRSLAQSPNQKLNFIVGCAFRVPDNSLDCNYMKLHWIIHELT